VAIQFQHLGAICATALHSELGQFLLINGGPIAPCTRPENHSSPRSRARGIRPRDKTRSMNARVSKALTRPPAGLASGTCCLGRPIRPTLDALTAPSALPRDQATDALAAPRQRSSGQTFSSSLSYCELEFFESFAIACKWGGYFHGNVVCMVNPTHAHALTRPKRRHDFTPTPCRTAYTRTKEQCFCNRHASRSRTRLCWIRPRPRYRAQGTEPLRGALLAHSPSPARRFGAVDLELWRAPRTRSRTRTLISPLCRL